MSIRARYYLAAVLAILGTVGHATTHSLNGGSLLMIAAFILFSHTVINHSAAANPEN